MIYQFYFDLDNKAVNMFYFRESGTVGEYRPFPAGTIICDNFEIYFSIDIFEKFFDDGSDWFRFWGLHIDSKEEWYLDTIKVYYDVVSYGEFMDYVELPHNEKTILDKLKGNIPDNINGWFIYENGKCCGDT